MMRPLGILILTALWLPSQLPGQRMPGYALRVARCASSELCRPEHAVTAGSAQHVTRNAQRLIVHYGKWLTAGTAVALTWFGAHEHNRSSRVWDQLMDLCRADNANCTLAPDGRYLNAEAERYYQSVRHFDRRARARLLSGQVALLVTVGLFVLDFGNGSGGPDNIPLAPFRVARAGVRLMF